MKKKIIVIAFALMIILVIASNVFFKKEDDVLHGSFQNVENQFESIHFDNASCSYEYDTFDGNKAISEKGEYKNLKKNEYLITSGYFKDYKIILSKDSIVLSNSTEQIYNKINDAPVKKN